MYGTREPADHESSQLRKKECNVGSATSAVAATIGPQDHGRGDVRAARMRPRATGTSSKVAATASAIAADSHVRRVSPSNT